jgi:thiamine-monophosphate kinase
MVGKAEHPIYRENAKNGDLIAITRGTGESALGLKCLLNKINCKYFINKHKKVIPDIKKGILLSRYVNSMIDVSDGLLLDLKRILNSSKKGASIFYENIPVSDKMSSLCEKYNFNEYELVLSGGEDYVLLFTISPKNELNLKKENTQYYIIGEINNNQDELIVKHNKKTIKLKDYGYDHFLHL